MNLISVRALTEQDMFLLFRNKWMSIHFPKEHPCLARQKFTACIMECLSFLDCKILEPLADCLNDFMIKPTCTMVMPEPFKHINQHDTFGTVG